MSNLQFKRVETFYELAEQYSVNTSTIHRWLKPIKDKLLKLSSVNKRRIRTINNNQLKMIYEFLGNPF